MTPEQRNAAMDRWEKARKRLSDAEWELECELSGSDDIEDIESDIMTAQYDMAEIEKEFPECRLWSTRKTPERERKSHANP